MDGNESRQGVWEYVSGDFFILPVVGAGTQGTGFILAGGKDMHAGRKVQKSHEGDRSRVRFLEDPEHSALADPFGEF